MGTGVAVQDGREFARLVEELADLEIERTGSGGKGLSGDSAGRRARVERRLMELLGTDLPGDERRKTMRVPASLEVQVKIAATTSMGRVTDVGAGGAFVETKASAKVGDAIEVEVARAKGAMTNGFHLRGRVAWVDGKGLGVGFAAASDGDERRLRRFVLDVLRDHLPAGHK